MGLKPETTSGGRALPFHASIRIDVRRDSGGDLKDENDHLYATGVKLKIVKNKLAPPYRIAESKIYYGKGFYRPAETLTYAVKLGIIEKSGAWYAYKNGKIGQGEKNAIAFLETNPHILNEIDVKVRTALLTGEIIEEMTPTME